VDDRDKLSREKLSRENLARMQEERDQEQARRLLEFRDRCFEAQKHIATLSTAASLLILAVYRERPFEESLLAVTLVLLALSAVIAVHGITFQAADVHAQASFLGYDKHIYWTTTIASNFLIMAVVTLALFLFHVPFWFALGVLGVVVVVYVALLLIRG
jgi:hypothetical protein